MANKAIEILRGVVGAVVGGVVGYFAFFWVARQGFYALALPGILLGAGCAALSTKKSTSRGVACGLAALAICVFTEWKFAPNGNDPSLAYLVTHLPEQGKITLLLLALGGIAGYWFGRDGMLRSWLPATKSPTPKPSPVNDDGPAPFTPPPKPFTLDE
jgi:hypothetical protein